MQEKKCYTRKKMGAEKMRKNEIMSNAINEFILDNDFLMRFIVDNVEEKIYSERTYNDGMIESVLINDLDNGYSESYILDFIIDEIEIYSLIDKIDDIHREDFLSLAKQCSNRN